MTHDTAIKEMWTQMMPPSLTLPDDYTILVWCKSDSRDIRFAIERTAKKMARNFENGVASTIEDAARYVSSVLMTRTQWRKSLEQKTGVAR